MADPVPAIPAAEVTSVVFAAFMVWVSALVQHFGNVAKRGADYVVSDRSVSPDIAGFVGRAHEDIIKQHRVGPHVCSAGAYRNQCGRRCRTKPLHRLDLHCCPPHLLVFVLAPSSSGTVACLAHWYDLLRRHVLRGGLNNDPSLGEPLIFTRNRCWHPLWGAKWPSGFCS